VSNQTARGARTRATASLPPWARPRALAFAATLAGALLGGCAAEGETAEAEGAVRDPSEAARLFDGIPQRGVALGDPAAPITLVEISDLRCSHCRDFAQITLPVIVDRYVRSGRLRVVFGDLPILGPASMQAARLAAAAGLQNHLFELTEAFFAEEPAPVTDDALRRVASDVPDLDVPAAMAARGSAAVDDVLAQARGLAERFSITGTPSFLLGRTDGQLTQLDEVWPTRPETLASAIDQALGGR
jgi:protein-disulfide isomerase